MEEKRKAELRSWRELLSRWPLKTNWSPSKICTFLYWSLPGGEKYDKGKSVQEKERVRVMRGQTVRASCLSLKASGWSKRIQWCLPLPPCRVPWSGRAQYIVDKGFLYSDYSIGCFLEGWFGGKSVYDTPEMSFFLLRDNIFLSSRLIALLKIKPADNIYFLFHLQAEQIVYKNLNDLIMYVYRKTFSPLQII